MPDEYILIERDEPIAIATINRPDKLNALNWALVAELADKLEALDRDETIRCVVLTGACNRAFAAGADIAEMADATPITMATGSFESWNRIRRIKKPIIATALLSAGLLGAGFTIGQIASVSGTSAAGVAVTPTTQTAPDAGRPGGPPVAWPLRGPCLTTARRAAGFRDP